MRPHPPIADRVGQVWELTLRSGEDHGDLCLVVKSDRENMVHRLLIIDSDHRLNGQLFTHGELVENEFTTRVA